MLGKKKPKEVIEELPNKSVDFSIDFSNFDGISGLYKKIIFRIESKDKDNVKLILPWAKTPEYGAHESGELTFVLGNKYLKPVVAELMLYFENLHTFLGRPEDDE